MRHLINILGIGSGTVLLTILALMCAEVFCRYVLNKPILGTVEISEYLLVLFVFSGMAYTQSISGHIKIDLITLQLPPTVQGALKIVSLLLALCVFGFISWETTKAFLISWQIKEVRWGALPLPVWPVKFVVAAGSVILCLQFVIDIADEFRSGLFRLKRK